MRNKWQFNFTVVSLRKGWPPKHAYKVTVTHYSHNSFHTETPCKLYANCDDMTLLHRSHGIFPYYICHQHTHRHILERIIVLFRFGWLKQWLNASILIIMHNSYTCFLPSCQLVLPTCWFHSLFLWLSPAAPLSIYFLSIYMCSVYHTPLTNPLWIDSECGFIHLEVCGS